MVSLSSIEVLGFEPESEPNPESEWIGEIETAESVQRLAIWELESSFILTRIILIHNII